MRPQPSDDSVLNIDSTARALDEFAAEDVNPTVVLNEQHDGMRGFECEAQPRRAVPSTAPLLDIAPAELSSGGSAEPLSRLEAEHARRRKRRRSPHLRVAARQGAVAAAKTVAKLCERSYTLMGSAHRASSEAAHALSAVATRAADSADVLSQRVWPLVRAGVRQAHAVALLTSSRSIAAAHAMSHRAAREWSAGTRAFTRSFTATGLEHQELNGSLVAVALAIVVVGYGGFLAVFWQTPADVPVTGAVTSFRPRAVATPVTTTLAPVMKRAAVVDAAQIERPRTARPVSTAVTRPASFTPNARTLTTLWQRRDTRSLDRAFATLRGETLALRRCGMRVTAVDRAVARCDGIAIDFQRTAGRWRITRVTRT